MNNRERSLVQETILRTMKLAAPPLSTTAVAGGGAASAATGAQAATIQMPYMPIQRSIKLHGTTMAPLSQGHMNRLRAIGVTPEDVSRVRSGWEQAGRKQ